MTYTSTIIYIYVYMYIYIIHTRICGGFLKSGYLKSSKTLGHKIVLKNILKATVEIDFKETPIYEYLQNMFNDV